MRKTLGLALLSNLLTLACSVETMNVGEKTTKDEDTEAKGEKASEPDSAPEKTTTTTTVVTTKESKAVKPEIVAKYQLVNDFHPNYEFIGQNYCVESHLRNCWIRSGYLTEYADGSAEVAIEFWDDSRDVPYTVKSDRIKDDHAFLLTDMAKAEGDDGFEYKMLWAVVDLEAKALNVVYDWANDGPGLQGDDLLETLEFQEMTPEETDGLVRL